jgi:arylformamidase
MLVYPGDVTPKFEQQDAGKYLISTLCLSSHTGTHIDAPTHYLKAGDSIDTLPLDSLIGPCQVIDLSEHQGVIAKSAFTKTPIQDPRILIKTSFSGKERFAESYPSLGLDAADYLLSRGVRCIGIDSPSIESFNCDGSVHRHLLENNCLIIELLDLSSIHAGTYDMIALPLRLTGLDGSPARVILRKRSGV